LELVKEGCFAMGVILACLRVDGSLFTGESNSRFQKFTKKLIFFVFYYYISWITAYVNNYFVERIIKTYAKKRIL